MVRPRRASSRRTIEEDPVTPRRPRRAAASTPHIQDDFVADENDDEYEEVTKEEDDDPEVEDVDEPEDVEDLKLDNDDPNDPDEEPEEQSPPVRRGRGRPPGSKNKTTLARERLGLIPVQPVRRRGPPKRKRDDDTADRRRGRKKRGRPSHLRKGPLLDDEGKPMIIENDEIVTPDDPKGDEKIDKNGNLLGGRQFKIRTFTCKNRGEKLFMISTEPARCMGFRDSYLLFQKHKRLLKVIIDEEEKMDLINREIIPHSYKGRTIGVVSARSVYKEFGAHVIINGKKVTDDYYEDKARESGAIEGAPADDFEDLSRNGGGDQSNGGGKRYLTNLAPSQSWMYEHASAVRMFDADLYASRNELYVNKGWKDPYTGINFLPMSTQPTQVSIKKILDESATEEQKRKLTIETLLAQPNSVVVTGLKDVPLEIFEDCVTPEVREAILKQQQLERARLCSV